MGVFSFDQFLYFVGMTSHPSLVSLLLLIHIFSFLIKKKEKKKKRKRKMRNATK